MMMSSPAWLRWTSSVVAALLAFVLVLGPLRVLYENQRPPVAPVQRRLGWTLKNAVRLDGATPALVGVAASQARFPAPAVRTAGAAVIVPVNDPALALATAPLAAPPVSAALFAVAPGDANAVRAEVARLGVSRVIVAGDAIARPPGGTALPADPAAAAISVAGIIAAARGGPPERVVLVDRQRTAEVIPLLPWLALSGDVVLFTSGGRMTPETAVALRKLGRVSVIYVSPDAATPPAGAALRTVALPSFAGPRGAVSFAEYRDPAGGLGWDYNWERRDGYHQYLIARTGDWQSAFGASTLAPSNRTPLLFTGLDALEPVTESYLWKMKPEYDNTPAEGPFATAWIAGGLDRIGFAPQARTDLSLEIEQYRRKGPAAASALELVMIGWIVLSGLLALWVALHVARRMRGMHWTMRWGWPLLVLVTGPVGLWMYLSLYRRRPRTDMSMSGRTMSTWHRDRGGQVGAATAMGVAFDMPLMVVVSYLVTWWFGMPPLIFESPLFWLGISMVVTMLIAFIIPLLISVFLYETPMQMMFRRVGYAAGLRYAWVPMLAAMTAGWAGMMGTMYLLHMVYPAGMGMPAEDRVRWWGYVLFSVLVGVLFEWLVNFWLVRTRRRPGSM